MRKLRDKGPHNRLKERVEHDGLSENPLLKNLEYMMKKVAVSM